VGPWLAPSSSPTGRRHTLWGTVIVLTLAGVVVVVLAPVATWFGGPFTAA
jgi:hypothetical protein